MFWCIFGHMTQSEWTNRWIGGQTGELLIRTDIKAKKMKFFQKHILADIFIILSKSRPPSEDSLHSGR